MNMIKLDKVIIKNNIYGLQKEIKRIAETTLRGDFANTDDRDYWVKRLRGLNSKLNALEVMICEPSQ